VKSLIQSFRSGELKLLDLPQPALRPGGVVVENAVSLMSPGTERVMIELGRKSLMGKARERPDLVRQVLEKARRDGILPTVEAVRNRLDSPVPLGYSCAGTVIEVGEKVDTFRTGDRVACAGAAYASHAEVVFIPKNLVARLPDEVDFESGAFTTLGAIALQGLRLAEVQLGETVVVIGLGLVGLLVVQLAKAGGCQVLGMDPNPTRCQLAEQLGCDFTSAERDRLVTINPQLTGGRGADAVLITAAAKSNDPVKLAGEVARDKATVVAIGAVGTNVPRDIYYKKELTFRISRSYGPGRYDSEYEEGGYDYPFGYVRWTENRNMQAFVQLLAEGRVDVKRLITHRFDIDDAHNAYEILTRKDDESFLGILFSYSNQPKLSHRVNLRSATVSPSKRPSVIGRPSAVAVGFLGAGQFAAATLIPAVKKLPGIEFQGVCAATGVSAQHVARKFDFRYCTTDENEIINDPDINTVVIATRHHLHARQIIAALRAGKHVFVEKPLCMNEEELKEIVTTFNQLSKSNQSNQILMVGYNRRFAPMARQLKDFLVQVKEPLVMHYRVNAGYIPPDHWVNDPGQGGGRIIGEVCHFVDFLTFLAGSLPVRVYARALPNQGRYRDDNLVITIDFANSSLGTITYVANGANALPKERIEVFGGESAAVLDNFRQLQLICGGHRKVFRSRLRQDKGHQSEWEAFAEKARSGQGSTIPFDEIVNGTLCTLLISRTLQDGVPVGLPKIPESN
jgi:predicted dehydrogenase/threonine dehydrogenase-like Zn-dependent dehydrogenase